MSNVCYDKRISNTVTAIFFKKKLEMILLPFCMIFTLFEKTAYGQNLNYSFQESNNCECGLHNSVSVRVYGGDETQPHEYPWMVALYYNEKMHCGGSLINERYIITAGHCLKWARKENLFVVLSMHDRVSYETTKSGGVTAEIEDIIVHENFKPNYAFDENDIGLIKLKYQVKFNEKLLPVCLPTRIDKTYAGEKAQFTGWGKASDNIPLSRFLKQGVVNVIKNEDCIKVSTLNNSITDSMLCGYMNGVDACQGDSGGPVIVEGNSEKMELVGIVSWGIGCATPETPGVYVRVTSFLQWIYSNTADAIYCSNQP